MKKILQKIIQRLPLIGEMYLENKEYKKNSAFPPGHYSSPIVSVDDIKNRENDIWKGLHVNGINGINLNTEEQLLLLKEFVKYYKEMPFGDQKKDNLRYYFDNIYYSYTDALTLYSFIRHYKPKKIIEVGSGFSSALMLDTRNLFLNNDIELTFIEPYPQRLYTLITETDKKNSKVIVEDLQKINVSHFEQLEANDILFIDSSHISKSGSDVNYILFDILPKLKSGVLIHFHDIFYPFEYPKDWVFGGRNWNEDYILRAFLMYNNDYKIKFFSHYLHTHFKDAFSEMPLFYKNTGGNLWIQKM